jgi:hypothetical protein
LTTPIGAPPVLLSGDTAQQVIPNPLFVEGSGDMLPASLATIPEDDEDATDATADEATISPPPLQSQNRPNRARNPNWRIEKMPYARYSGGVSQGSVFRLR